MIKPVIMAIFLFGANSACADTTNVTFTATVTQSPCSLQDGYKDQTIAYGNFTSQDIYSVHEVGGIISSQSFSLLFDCPIGIQNINITFSGITSPTNGQNLYNQAADGTKGIVVGIIAQNEPVDFTANKKYIYPVTPPGLQSIVFLTKLERTSDEPFSLGQTGEFEAISTLTMIYD